MLTGRTAPTSARAALYRALGDETRLRIIDALQLSDRSPKELAALTGTASNLLAFHLDVLEDAGLITRIASQGDARRRYVTLDRRRFALLVTPPQLAASTADRVLFVCTANSARSQLAAALWRARTGADALSAGTDPADRVHPEAVGIARQRGLDLGGARPRGYGDLDVVPDLVVSVCDRARESSIGFDAPLLHWSVPDPVGGDCAAFARAFDDISDRVEHLARAVHAA